MHVKKNLGYRISLALAPFIYKIISKFLFPSCRIEVLGRENCDELARTGQPYIATFWHHGLFYITALDCTLPWAGMVSASADGEYIARILESLGFETIRGSRNRQGMAALKGLISVVKEKRKNVAIVADGSQGPPLVAQAGAVLLASKTGAPIVPCGWAADRYIAFNSWDRTVLPKPFSRVVVRMGAPLFVPPDLKSAGIEEYRLEFQKRLKDNYDAVWGAFGIKEH